MKVDTILSSSVLTKIHKELGEGGLRLAPGDEETRSLVQHREDHVWIWNTKERCLLVAVTGSRNTGPGAEVQRVALSAGPGHEVTGLEVSRTGRWVALWGRDGASVIMMPPRGGLGGRFGGGKEQLVAACRALDTRGETVQGAAWHPGSAAECHLVVLARSGVLSLHNVAELEDTTTVLTCDLGRGEDNKVAAALGEVAVDFCFGSSAGAGGVWPVFVLLASCDVYTVGAGLGAEQWRVEGPLEVRPSLEDNYSDGEGCSLVEVGGVLALATVRGVVYHGILLGGDTAQLRVYERVELGPGAVVTSHEDVFSCPLRLSSCDTVTRPGYLAAHPAGLHAVHLAMVTVLRQAELEADPGLDLAAGSSVVEHLVCTRPSLAAPPAPVLGACLAWPPATLLCLLASNTLTCLSLPPSAAQAAPLLSGAREAEERAGGAPQPRVEAALLALLARRSTQPLLAAAPATELSPALTLELLTSATQTLRREYVARLEVARLELERRVSELAAKRRDQAGLVARLEAERGRARDKAELLSEKYEDVRDRGQELGHRVEAVLSKLQAKIPQLSDKELAMAREVSGLDRRVQALEGGVKQLREKEKYQRYQIGAETSAAPGASRDTRLDNVKEVLQRDSRSIADLVRTVTELRKDLELQ